jgi:DNA repair protein RAD5
MRKQKNILPHAGGQCLTALNDWHHITWHDVTVEMTSVQPSAKRKLPTLSVPYRKKKTSKTAPEPVPSLSESTYLGSFLVPNAWSTCRGSGRVKAGEVIYIQRGKEDM